MTNTGHTIQSGHTGYVKIVSGEVIALTATELVNELGAVQSVVAGTNVTVDATDPRNPIVASS